MNILVLCTGNSCRSQMAHAYLKLYCNAKNVTILSAGVETHGVNPSAIKVLLEDGIDISNYTSNNVSEYLDVNFDIVITVCDNAKERCPVLPSKATSIHHTFHDPAKATGTENEVLNEFRKVREEIKQYCKLFATEHNLL